MALYPDYITAEQLKPSLGISDDIDDVEIGFAISAASRAIDQYTNRQFGVLSVPQARYYTPFLDGSKYVAVIDDLMTTTSLAVRTNDEDGGSYGTALVFTTDYYLSDLNASALNRPYTRLIARNGSFPLREGSIEITGLWGWTAVPAQVVQATLIQSARLFKRKDAPFGVAGSPNDGSETRLLAKLDPDVQMLLKPLVRQWGAV